MLTTTKTDTPWRPKMLPRDSLEHQTPQQRAAAKDAAGLRLAGRDGPPQEAILREVLRLLKAGDLARGCQRAGLIRRVAVPMSATLPSGALTAAVGVEAGRVRAAPPK
jgi:hypothetical protein